MLPWCQSLLHDPGIAGGNPGCSGFLPGRRQHQVLIDQGEKTGQVDQYPELS